MSEEKTTAERGTNPDDATYGGFVICPRCGFDTRVKVGPVKEEDKQEYIRNLLGGIPFTKDYTMFDGQLSVRFKDLTVAESDKLAQMLHGCLQDPLFLIKGSQLKILLSLVQIKKGEDIINIDREKVMAAKDAQEGLAIYQEVFKGYPDGVTAMITTLYNSFSQQLFHIVNSSVDKNF